MSGSLLMVRYGNGRKRSSKHFRVRQPQVLCNWHEHRVWANRTEALGNGHNRPFQLCKPVSSGSRPDVPDGRTFRPSGHGADDVAVTSRRWPVPFCGILVCALVLAAGCGYDEGEDLPPLVEGVVPEGAEQVGECGGSPGLIESPSHHCTYFVPGELDEVTEDVAEALTDEGFDLSCRRDAVAVEIAGLQPNVRVRAEITDNGSVKDWGQGAVNVFEPGYVPAGARSIPTGAVALYVSASRQSEAGLETQRAWTKSGFACAEETLHRQTLDGCAEAWNGPENEANRRLARARMRVPVADVILRDSNTPRVSSGCFFGFLAHGGRYLIFESSWTNAGLVFAEAELGYSSRKGLDANALVRPDGSLELKRPTLNERCEVWWNASAGWKTRALAHRRGLLGEVEAFYDADGEAARCTYTFRIRARFLRVVAEFDDGEWVWTPFRRLTAQPQFDPNGELGESGWLSVGP